jgi:hypothetical protein
LITEPQLLEHSHIIETEAAGGGGCSEDIGVMFTLRDLSDHSGSPGAMGRDPIVVHPADPATAVLEL